MCWKVRETQKDWLIISAVLSDVTISSVHTSDLSSFEESGGDDVSSEEETAQVTTAEEQEEMEVEKEAQHGLFGPPFVLLIITRTSGILSFHPFFFQTKTVSL